MLKTDSGKKEFSVLQTTCPITSIGNSDQCSAEKFCPLSQNLTTNVAFSYLCNIARAHLIHSVIILYL